jgi:hypothetical protein
MSLASAGVVAINSTAEVAGDFTDLDSQLHGYIRSPNGKFAGFDVPGVSSIQVMTIAGNDRAARSLLSALTSARNRQ